MTEHEVGTRQEGLAARIPVGSSLLLLGGVVAVAWVVTVERMRGMDEGPGTHLGELGWFLGVWVTMTAAMMLPSTARLVARVAGGLPTVLFAAGYVAAWTVYGLAAYGVFRLVQSWGPEWLAWDRGGPYVAGGAILIGGLYELTPLKDAFLSRCRSPRHGLEPSLGAGLGHGLDCVVCCFGLMLVLFALGVMSILWMAVVAAVIFAEKVLPHGFGLTRVVAVALVALGLWVGLSPSSVPGLTEPGDTPPSMRMEM
jgi:predicted metal-binding membrane protein